MQIRLIASNAAWLGVEKIARVACGLIVLAVAARSLQVDLFGQYVQASAIAAIATVIATFGLNGVVVNRLIRDRRSADQILSSAMLLQAAMSAATAVGVTALLFLPQSEHLSRAAVLSLCLIPLFRFGDAIRFQYESIAAMRPVVLAECAALCIGTAAKIAVLRVSGDLWIFCAVHVAEAFLASGLIFFAHGLGNAVPRLTAARKAEVSGQIAQSWPLVVSSLGYVVYTKVDQLVLGQAVSNAAAGVYAAGSRVAEAVGLAPTILGAAVFPLLAKSFHEGSDQHKRRVQLTYDVVAAIAIALALFVNVFADAIVLSIYGSEYGEAAIVLRINSWGAVFLAVATVGGKQLLLENRQSLTMTRHLLGAAISVSLNIYLSPRYGIVGAAVAYTFSFFLANYLFDAMMPNTRNMFHQKTNAIFMSWLWSKRR